MDFEEKVKTLRKLPEFKVHPISEIRALAFVARESTEPKESDNILVKTNSGFLLLEKNDALKITITYPDLLDQNI